MSFGESDSDSGSLWIRPCSPQNQAQTNKEKEWTHPELSLREGFCVFRTLLRGEQQRRGTEQINVKVFKLAEGRIMHDCIVS